MLPLFEILKTFLIQNKKLWGVTFLFEVDWLSVLGVIGKYLIKLLTCGRVEKRREKGEERQVILVVALPKAGVRQGLPNFQASCTT